MNRRRCVRWAAASNPPSRGLRVSRRLVSASVVVVVVASGWALGAPPSVVAAQTLGDLPAWVTLSGEFALADGTGLGDSEWNYNYPTADWSANIQWGTIATGDPESDSRVTSGDRITDERRLCHGPRDVDLAAVQFELTWRSHEGDDFVPCERLAALFGASLTVDLEPGGTRSFTCDLLYSFLKESGGTYVDCLTTRMTARPAVLPETLTLVSLEQTEDFSIDVITSVPPQSIRSGTSEAIAVRIADAR